MLQSDWSTLKVFSLSEIMSSDPNHKRILRTRRSTTRLPSLKVQLKFITKNKAESYKETYSERYNFTSILFFLLTTRLLNLKIKFKAISQEQSYSETYIFLTTYKAQSPIQSEQKMFDDQAMKTVRIVDYYGEMGGEGNAGGSHFKPLKDVSCHAYRANTREYSLSKNHTK